MTVTRLDAVDSEYAFDEDMDYSVSAGTDRVLVVGVHQEDTGASQPTVTYGGESMTHIVGIFTGESNGVRQDLFFLNDAGIVAASGITIQLSTVPFYTAIVAGSFKEALQTTPTVYDSDMANSSTPNPVISEVVVADGSWAIGFAGVGIQLVPGASWDSDLTEQLERITDSSTCSWADKGYGTGQTVAGECTWSSQNLAATLGLEIKQAAAGGSPLLLLLNNGDLNGGLK